RRGDVGRGNPLPSRILSNEVTNHSSQNRYHTLQDPQYGMDLPGQVFPISLSSSVGFVSCSSVSKSLCSVSEKENPTKKSATNFISPETEEDITPMISQVQDVLFNVSISQEGWEFHSFAFKDDGCSVGLIHPDLVEFTGS